MSSFLSIFSSYERKSCLLWGWPRSVFPNFCLFICWLSSFSFECSFSWPVLWSLTARQSLCKAAIVLVLRRGWPFLGFPLRSLCVLSITAVSVVFLRPAFSRLASYGPPWMSLRFASLMERGYFFLISESLLMHYILNFSRNLWPNGYKNCHHVLCLPTPLLLFLETGDTPVVRCWISVSVFMWVLGI